MTDFSCKTTGTAWRGLLPGVELLSLDAGNTLIFLDYDRFAATLARLGEVVSPARVCEAEGRAKRLHAQGELLPVRFAGEGKPGGKAWGDLIGNLLHSLGIGMERVRPVLEVLWEEHLTRSFWTRVPPGLKEALVGARQRGLRVVVVSNSEGKLAELFDELGLSECLDLLVDSGVLGIEKPDTRIFHHAIRPFGVTPDRVLHLGDSLAADIEGGRRAGFRVALVDPFGQWDGAHPGVLRVPSVAEVAQALPST